MDPYEKFKRRLRRTPFDIWRDGHNSTHYFHLRTADNIPEEYLISSSDYSYITDFFSACRDSMKVYYKTLDMPFDPAELTIHDLMRSGMVLKEPEDEISSKEIGTFFNIASSLQSEGIDAYVDNDRYVVKLHEVIYKKFNTVVELKIWYDQIRPFLVHLRQQHFDYGLFEYDGNWPFEED